MENLWEPPSHISIGTQSETPFCVPQVVVNYTPVMSVCRDSLGTSITNLLSFTIGVPELCPYAPPLEKIMVAKGGK